jgi:5,10-methylenetetrahydromethanopterin reductase
MAAQSLSERAALLGAYVLPGGPTDPTPIIEQARAGESLGMSHLFIGERYSTKDLGALAGALTQVTERAHLVGGVTHIGTRHPMVLASMGQTLQALSGGRFILGFGRGSAGRWSSYGLPMPTSQMLEDMAGILRRLWAGERVSYDGPAGSFPDLLVQERPDVAPPPLILAGVGPSTLAVAGRAYDAVMLHPFLTPDAVGRATQRVRDAAASAGRDPEAIAIHATVIVAPDREPAEVLGARALGYLLVRGLGEALVAANGWDPAQLDAIRAHDRFAGLDYNGIKAILPPELAVVARDLPEDWLASAAATGSTADCVSTLDDYLAAGADNILIHGSTPDQLGDFVHAFAAS